MSPRETADTKARRLLTSGAVTLMAVSPPRIIAHVTGDHDRYQVAWTPVVGWVCECPDLQRRCSHLQAVQLVTLPTPTPTVPDLVDLEAADGELTRTA